MPQLEAPAGVFSHFAYLLATNGWLGVDLFFVLSGYLLASQILRASQESRFSRLQFLSRRAWRTLPPYLLVLLVSWLGLFGLEAATHGASGDYLALLANLLLLNDYIEPSILVVFWSLAVEEKSYLAMALLLPLLARWPWCRSALLLLIVVGSLSLLRYMSYSPAASETYSDFFWTYRSPAHHAFTGILVGVATAFMAPWARRQRYGTMMPLAWLAFAGILILLIARPWTEADYWQSSLLVIPLLSLLVGAALLATPHIDSRWGGQLQRRPIGAIAAMAYSLYLTHYPIACLFSSLLPPRDASLAQQTTYWSCYLATAFLIGGIFYFLVERPCIQRSRRGPAARPEAPPSH